MYESDTCVATRDCACDSAHGFHAIAHANTHARVHENKHARAHEKAALRLSMSTTPRLLRLRSLWLLLFLRHRSRHPHFSHNRVYHSVGPLPVRPCAPILERKRRIAARL